MRTILLFLALVLQSQSERNGGPEPLDSNTTGLTKPCASLYSRDHLQLDLKDGERVTWKKSQDKEHNLAAVVFRGCFLTLSDAAAQEKSPSVFHEGAHVNLGEAFDGPVLDYRCECGRPGILIRTRRATHQDFLDRHVLGSIQVPNTNKEWTQLMHERKIFGKPFNTFIYGEIDQIQQAFEGSNHGYTNYHGWIKWSKYSLVVTSLRYQDDRTYRAVIRKRKRYVAVGFENGLPVHLDKTSASSPQEKIDQNHPY
ncbi:uncharacterized protein LOC106703144 [Latimeria chalumnae]|uniref:uncharacterized protein LOC106703144 n=1 Tax=Latimeria chalumnae TaxID=7897 RepID=UPI0006D8F4BF|nr:PREDICTED: uncharacterized protein LOC106703144 [Latimeria chalumnae]|eukprot:XP_014342772.1 PREDICTED: uncharacterized protein LOC106703144 [Latimeria chalumnae]